MLDEIGLFHSDGFNRGRGADAIECGRRYLGKTSVIMSKAELKRTERQ
jgi:hypothetical protein